MKPLKPLSPTLKEKKRYIAFEIISKGKITDKTAVSKAIWGAAQSFLGTLGLGFAGLKVLPEYNAVKQRGLLRIGHNSVSKLKMSLALINEIDKEPVVVRTIGVSGIINKAQKKYLEG